MNGVVEDRGILVELTIEGVVVGKRDVLLEGGDVAEGDNVGAEGIEAGGDHNLKLVPGGET